MPRRLGARGLWAVVAAVVVLVLVVAGVAWWRSRDHTSFHWAVDHAPAGTQRLSWTDWAAVRRREGARLDENSSASDVRRFLTQAFDDDLSSRSALLSSAPVLQAKYGFSPATADWELYSQSDQGAVDMVHLPSAVDLGDVADDLQSLGYVRPSSSTGVWRGGQNLLARTSADLTPELAYIAINTSDSVVLTSDNAAYLALAERALEGDGDRMTGVGGVVDDAGEPVSAAVYTGSYACSALAMAHAGAADQRAGDRLVADAGEVNPYSAFAMSMEPDRSVRISFSFDSSEEAHTNADSRAKLAEGPAPGQGGSFGERFHVDSVTAHGSLVVLRVTPAKGAYVLSDLSTGPVLFATC